jgi:hypothetical protein
VKAWDGKVFFINKRNLIERREEFDVVVLLEFVSKG